MKRYRVEPNGVTITESLRTHWLSALRTALGGGTAADTERYPVV